MTTNQAPPPFQKASECSDVCWQHASGQLNIPQVHHPRDIAIANLLHVTQLIARRDTCRMEVVIPLEVGAAPAITTTLPITFRYAVR